MSTFESLFGELRSMVHLPSVADPGEVWALLCTLHDHDRARFHEEVVHGYLEHLLHKLPIPLHRVSTLKALEDASQILPLPCFHLEGFTDVDIVDVVSLARVTSLTHVHTLDLYYKHVAHDGALALAKTPHLSNLHTLDISYNYLGDDSAQVLLQSPYLHQLRVLDLAGNKIELYSDNYINIFNNLNPKKTLHSLDLSSNLIEDHGVDILANSEFLSSVHTLKLSYNTIHTEAALTLLTSPLITAYA